MHSIRFDYLYRDGSNFKKWSNVVFSNPHGLHVNIASEAIRNVLWGDDLFIAHQIRVPEVFLFTKGDINLDDHCFHEFYGFESSNQTPTDRFGRTAIELVAEVIAKAKGGWRVFDPLERL